MRSKQCCHPLLPATANAHSPLRSCKRWSLMIATHRVTLTLLLGVLAQAVLALCCWLCSCGGVTKPRGGGGQLVRGSSPAPLHPLGTAAGDRLVLLSVQVTAASAATPCTLLLCHKPLGSAVTSWETTSIPSACSRVYSHARANPSSTTANGGRSLGSVLGN